MAATATANYLPPGVPLLRVADTLVYLELSNCGLSDESLDGHRTVVNTMSADTSTSSLPSSLMAPYSAETKSNSRPSPVTVFRSFAAVTLLDLSGNILTTPPRALPPKLRTLLLARNALSSLAYLEAMGATLRRLDVSRNFLGPATNCLQPLVPLSQVLETLDLSGNPISTPAVCMPPGRT